MKTIPTHAVWHDGTDMNAAMLTGRAITTDASTAGMVGVLSMTHGIILHGMAPTVPGTTHGTTTHGIMDMQDGMVAGMVVGMDGIHIIPGVGDGMTIIILCMAAQVAEVEETEIVPLTASRPPDSHAPAPSASVAAA